MLAELADLEEYLRQRTSTILCLADLLRTSKFEGLAFVLGLLARNLLKMGRRVRKHVSFRVSTSTQRTSIGLLPLQTLICNIRCHQKSSDMHRN